jgi:thioredoxin-dependent peroxiredoxin
MALSVGDRAPDFEAKDTQGNVFRLADQKGKKNVVLFFYPRAFTPGCTTEVCSFRDVYDELDSADTVVVGVSTDDLATQEKFAGAHRLQFPLLGDDDRTIAKAYGAIGLLGSVLGVTKRVTYVIDKQGILRGVFRHELAVDRHIKDVKSTLAAMA